MIIPESTNVATGDIALSHDGLDTAGPGRHVSHLRSTLEHHGLLPQRYEPLARFEAWLTTKLDAITEPGVRAPVEQFATWHHLRRLRRNSTPGQSSEGPKRSAKQEITETIKFLTWLHDTHHRAAATFTQQAIDEYLTSGPTTRHSIRTFFIWAKTSRINPVIDSEHTREPPPTVASAQPGGPVRRNCPR